MTGRRLFGVETEYAVTAVTATGEVYARAALCSALLRAATRTLPHLPGTYEPGLFLGNGSRLYVDAGSHPELSGPEVVTPHDAVRYLRAGDSIMMRLAEEVRRRNPSLARLDVFAGNVDYSGSGATWGAHESYCHRASSDLLRRRLLPHLVSRVIYCGAGGFNPLSSGLEFTLSPRAYHVNHAISDQSTHDRGIAHTRNEPLGGHGYRREHIICGESLRSDLAAWLKVGTTALVVALIEADVACGDDCYPVPAVEALRAFAADTTCTHGAGLKSGGRITAIDIQRRYLQTARAYVGCAFMPSWTAKVCDAWEQILDRLCHEPEWLSGTLDWAIKLTIYRAHSKQRGFEWNTLPAWTHVVQALEHARRSIGGQMPPLSRALVDSDRGPLKAQFDSLVPHMDRHALDWAHIDRFLELRRELFETDTRWGQLGTSGVFAQLDRAGVLDHRVDGVDRVEEAVDQPPAEGRASVRGQVVQRVMREREGFSAGWDHVCHYGTGAQLDLSDPFAENEHWTNPVLGTLGMAPEEADPAASGQPGVLDEISRLIGRVRTRSRATPQRPGSGTVPRQGAGTP